jgi:GNAT superfamily N-acetyltransferase
LAATNPAPVAVELSAVHAGDFEALVAVRAEAMRESLERIGRWDPARSRERFRAVFSPEHTRHILVGGQPVGFVAVKPHGDGLLLDHLYISVAWQGRGVGGAVLAQVFCEADALALPLRVVALRESASNRFYLRHGFQPAGREEFDNHYVRHPPRRKGAP